MAISKDFYGADLAISNRQLDDIPRGKLCVGDLYFRPEKMRGLSGRPGSNTQTTAGYEKIRTVGKGNKVVFLYSLNLQRLTNVRKA